MNLRRVATIEAQKISIPVDGPVTVKVSSSWSAEEFHLSPVKVFNLTEEEKAAIARLSVERIEVTAEEFERMLDICQDPAPPSPALLAAARRYRERLRPATYPCPGCGDRLAIPDRAVHVHCRATDAYYRVEPDGDGGVGIKGVGR